MTQNVFDEQGNVIEVSTKTPLNDLTRAPVYNSLPHGVLYVPIVIAAKDGRPRLALVAPSVIATSDQVGSLTQRLAAMEPLAAQFAEEFPEQASKVQWLVDAVDALPDFAVSYSQALSDIAGLKTGVGAKADAATVASLATQVSNKADTSALAGKANTADIPLAADAAPPAVGFQGKKGSSTRFALADHTHEETVKWGAVDQATNTSGIWVRQLPANRFISKPGVICGVKSPAGTFQYKAAVTGTAAAGFTITVTFTKDKETVIVPLPAIVIGAAATNINVALKEAQAATGVVTFDVICFEGSAT